MKLFLFSFFALLFFIQLQFYVADEYKLQYLIFETSYILMIIYSIRNYYLMSAVSLFILVTFFYLSAGPMDLHFFQNINLLDAKRMGVLLLFGYSFIFFLLFFWTLLDGKILKIKALTRLDYTLTNSNYSQILYKTVAILIIVLVFFYIYKFVTSFGFVIGASSRGELYSNKSFVLTLAKTLLPFLIITYIWLKKYYRNVTTKFDYIIILTVITFLLFDILYKGDRRITVSLLLAIAGIYYFHKNLPKKYIIFGILGAVFLYFYGAVRNRPIYLWSDSIVNFITRDFSPSLTEFGPFSMIANYIMKDDLYVTMPTFFSSLLSTVPGFIYPDRPLASSVWFVKTYFYNYYLAGGGMAFNIIADAALNFGYLAPLFLAFFYLAFFTLGKQKGSIAPLINALLIYSLTFSARFDFTSIFQIVSFGWILLLFVFLFTLIFKKDKL